MKYRLVLNFQIKKENSANFTDFITKAMNLFREIFPDAEQSSGAFATVEWFDTPIERDAIGTKAKLDLDVEKSKDDPL